MNLKRLKNMTTKKKTMKTIYFKIIVLFTPISSTNIIL